MPAVNQRQRRLFGMVRAAQRGETPASPQVAKIAASISPVDAKKFAKTKEKNLPESAVPGKPAERLGAVTAIPEKERDAARQRLLAKTKEIRDKKKIKEELENLEEVEIEEGMSLKDFKANRTKLKRRESSADAKKRGHVGKEWYNSGRTYSPDEAKRSRAKIDDEERSTRKRSAIDPDAEDSDYSADKTKNPKKIRKQAAMGEDFVSELNRYEKEIGKDYKTGKEVKSGGSTDKAFTTVKKMMRSQTGKPAGQRKKEPGKKPPVAGSYGAPQSPAQKIAKRRADAKRAQDNMSSRFD